MKSALLQKIKDIESRENGKTLFGRGMTTEEQIDRMMEDEREREPFEDQIFEHENGTI